MADDKTAAVADDVISVSIVLEASESLAAVYSNFVQVRAGEHDFFLDFGQVVPPTPDDARTTGVIKSPVRARIILPASVVPRLVKALETVLDRHSKGVLRGSQEG